MYEFNTKPEMIYINIDANNVFKDLQKIYKIKNKVELGIKIKYIIKNIKEFNKLCSTLNIEKKELLVILNNIFPELFNKRMLTSLKRIYNTRENRSTMKTEARVYGKTNCKKCNGKGFFYHYEPEFVKFENRKPSLCNCTVKNLTKLKDKLGEDRMNKFNVDFGMEKINDIETGFVKIKKKIKKQDKN